jgi:hypothetical protein
MILHTQPTKPWNEYDFLLIEAYQILQDERCSQCGLPEYICHNESNLIQVQVNEDSCAVMAAKAKKERQMSRGKKDYTPPDGVILRPEPYTADGSDLASFRGDYYRDLAEKRKAVEAGRYPSVT